MEARRGSAAWGAPEEGREVKTANRARMEAAGRFRMNGRPANRRDWMGSRASRSRARAARAGGGPAPPERHRAIDQLAGGLRDETPGAGASRERRGWMRATAPVISREGPWGRHGAITPVLANAQWQAKQ